MKNKTRGSYLFKNTVIFGISAIATKIIQFLLVPLYTKVLSPTDYGNVDLLFTICSFVYPLITLNIAEAVYRFSLDKNKDDNKISSIAMVCFALSLFLGLLFIPFLSAFESFSNYSLLFYLYLITLSLSQILLVTLKGREKLKLFAIGNIINVLFIAMFNILFLVVFKLGVYGYFYGYILSNIITIIYALFFAGISNNIKTFIFDKNLFISMIKYSIVLIPTSFMWWIINSSDRVMVTSMISSYANGIYSVSYKIPSVLTVVATIFNQAWLFSAVNEKDSLDGTKYTNRIFEYFYTFIIIGAVLLMILIKLFYHLYVSSEYYESWKFIPLLLVGFVFMTMATFVSSLYNVHKDSKGFLFSGMTGAIANIVLNLLMIPIFGIYGAAFATAVSYIIVFIYRVIDTKKYMKIDISSNFYINIVTMIIALSLSYMRLLYVPMIQFVLLILLICINKDKINYIVKFFVKKLTNRGC